MVLGRAVSSRYRLWIESNFQCASSSTKEFDRATMPPAPRALSIVKFSFYILRLFDTSLDLVPTALVKISFLLKIVINFVCI